MIHCFFLMSRQGRSRLTKWYSTVMSQKQKQKFLKQVNTLVLTRKPHMCNFIQCKQYKVIYKRYASLYFITIVDKDENELIVLQIIQQFVDILDKYFGNVCELDLIFNFHKTYFILDELIISGYVAEASRKLIQRELEDQKILLQEEVENDNKKK